MVVIIGVMMVVDLGGLVNKVVLIILFVLLISGIYVFNIVVMVGIVILLLGLGFVIILVK